MFIKKGDTVVVLSGKDKYANTKDDNGKLKTAKVLEVSPEEGKVIVENVHKVSKHLKARKQGEQSTILKVDAPIYACKVQLYCPDCKKGVRSKAVFKDGKDGKQIKVRACVKCGYEFD